jgi:hypothetical protein
MKKSEEEKAKRRLDAMARGEENIRERLHGLRGELDLIARLLDRVAMTKHPRIMADAGPMAHGSFTALGLPRGITDLAAFRQRRGPR